VSLDPIGIDILTDSRTGVVETKKLAVHLRREMLIRKRSAKRVRDWDHARDRVAQLRKTIIGVLIDPCFILGLLFEWNRRSSIAR